MKLGLLFAGQGSQKTGMGKDLYDTYPAFRRIFDLLSEEQRTAAFEGPAEVLSDTKTTQPVMVAFAAGVLAVLKELLTEEEFAPAACAGLSLGEYSALHAAGVWDAETAVRLVSARGRYMSRAAEGIRCKMCAVMGLARPDLEQACEEASCMGTVQIANDNCPGQLVVAGEREAVDLCVQLAQEKGARRCTELAVSGPFHTVFMEPAGKKLEALFAETEFKEPEIPVVFNYKGAPLAEGETVSRMLVKQVSGGVRFTDSIRWMESFGIDTVLEIGPGRTLSGFVRKTAEGIRCISVENCESLEKAVEILKEEAR